MVRDEVATWIGTLHAEQQRNTFMSNISAELCWYDTLVTLSHCLMYISVPIHRLSSDCYFIESWSAK